MDEEFVVKYDDTVIATTSEVNEAFNAMSEYIINVLHEKPYYYRYFTELNKMNILCVDFGSYSHFFHIISHNFDWNAFILGDYVSETNNICPE